MRATKEYAEIVYEKYLEEYEHLLNFKDIIICIGRSENENDLSNRIYWMHHEYLEAVTS